MSTSSDAPTNINVPQGEWPTIEEIMAALDEDSEYFRPRLFAIYGTRNNLQAEHGLSAFLGWGIDHRDDLGALFWCAEGSQTHRSDSAERIVAFHRRLGTAELKWLD
ncbi:MAG: hypothetical protein ACRDRL_23540 [Sciscionella sp.]